MSATDQSGKPVITEEEIKAIARRWELKSENAKLGAILRRLLVADRTGVSVTTWEEWEDDSIIHHELVVDTEIELSPEEFELVEGLMGS